MTLSDYSAIFQYVGEVAKRLKLPIYLVGGTIRDSLLGLSIEQSDLDFTVVGDAELLAEAIAREQSASLKVFNKFRTAKVVFTNDWCGISELDFVGTRRESYRQPGCLPTVMPGNLEQDLDRRDFSINALACRLEDVIELVASENFSPTRLRVCIVDRHLGLRDLDQKVIRILHENSFLDDPTRVFRAARYKGRIAGRLDESTTTCLRDAIAQGALATISLQRAERELKLILAEASADKIIDDLIDWQVFSVLGWLKESDRKSFQANWARVSGVNNVELDERLELFKLSCVYITPEANQIIAENLLVSSRKLKSWKRYLGLIAAGKMEQVEDLFLHWAAASGVFPEWRAALDQELLSRKL